MSDCDGDRLPDDAIPAIKAVMEDLVAGNFQQLEHDGRSGRATSCELAHALYSYSKHTGESLAVPPDVVYERQAFAMCVKIKNEYNQWGVDIDFWNMEGEMSDLTAALTLTKILGNYDVEIDDIRVM